MRTNRNLSSLQDDELLRQLDESAARSPVIKELCARLEKANERPSERTAQCECPICLGELQAYYGEANDVLELKTT